MNQVFGNYTIENDKESWKLNRKITSKEVFDILKAIAQIVIPAIFIAFLLRLSFQSGFSWVYLGIVSVCSFYIFLRIPVLFEFFSNPKAGIIKFSKSSKTITIKHPLLRKDSIALSELNSIDCQLHNDIVNLGSGPFSTKKERFWVEMYFVLKNHECIQFLHINPNYIMDPDSLEISRHLTKLSKSICKSLAKELQVISTFKEVNRTKVD